MDYNEYIQSEKWQVRSRWTRQSRGNKCQVCGVSGAMVKLHVHHNTYENLGCEGDNDLVVLCEDCHKLFHESGMKPGRKIEITLENVKKYLFDNGITYTNDEPWYYYSLGKDLIWDLVGYGNWKQFDKFNKVNIEIVDIACQNMVIREQQNE